MGDPAGTPAPLVTVVVPARDAADTIGRAVRHVLAQEGAPPFELVVVDNASEDGTAEVARAAGARVVRLEGRSGGPGRARNAGVAAGTGAAIAFTDADCFPTPGWLAALWSRAASAELVAGPVVADATAVRGDWDRTLEYPAATPLWATANLLIDRAALEGAGGFLDWVADEHEAPRRPFGEDTVVAWRAIRAGARTAWAQDAVVAHAVFPRDARGYVAQFRDLRHMPGLVRQVPELRRELLTGRLVLNAATGTGTAALAGVLGAAVLGLTSAAVLGLTGAAAGRTDAAGRRSAAAGRRPVAGGRGASVGLRRALVPLLLAAPWAVRQVRVARRVGVRIAAVRAAGELVGAASLAVGSVEHRTPVL